MQTIVNKQCILDIIREGVPAGYVINTCIGMYAGIIGTRIKGVINGMRIIPNLYCVNVGPPSSYKSFVFDQFYSIVKKIQMEYQQEQKRIKQELSLSGVDKIVIDGVEYTSDCPNRTIYINNMTMEGLYRVIRDYPHGTMLLNDELYNVFGSFGKYSDGVKVEHQALIRLYHNDLPSIALKGDKNTTQIVDKVALSIVGAMTNDNFYKIFSYAGDGFRDRFLYSIRITRPEESVRFHSPDFSEIENDFRYIINNYTNFKVEIEIPKKAEEYITGFINHKKKSDNDTLHSYLSKMNMNMYRLLVVLAVIRDVENPVINDDVIDDCLELSEEYVRTFLSNFNIAHEDPLIKLSVKMREAYFMLPNEFEFEHGFELVKKLMSKRSYYRLIRDKGLFSRQESKVYKI